MTQCSPYSDIAGAAQGPFKSRSHSRVLSRSGEKPTLLCKDDHIRENDRFAGKVGFPRLGEYSNVGSESGKGKTTLPGICDIRSFWLQVLSEGFPHARPRMYRFEVGVAACILIEAHSHSLSSFRRIKL